MLNGNRFSDHPIFSPQPSGSIGGAKPGIQALSTKAEEIASATGEVPSIAARIYRPSPVVNPNTPLSLGAGEGMISRIYQQVAPTPEEVAQAAQSERKFSDKIRNWVEFGKFK